MTVQGGGRRGPLIEREAELTAIDAAIAAACDGEGSLVLVEGHAGIGKSALLEESCRRAARAGMTILSGHGSELERDHSFGVTMQLYAPLVARADPAARADLLGGAAVLAGTLFEDRPAAAESPEEQVFGVLHALYWLTSNVAERGPLLIAADDAHWTDRSTLRFFLYLAQRLRDLRVLLVAAARVNDPGAPEDLLRPLRGHRNSRVLRPAPLTRLAVEIVVHGRMSHAEPAFVDACLAATEGNPYLLGELLTDLGDREVEPTSANAALVGRLAPESVLDAALVRLARLPAGSTALARAVAVLEEDATFAHASKLAGLERETAVAVADALIAAEIVRSREPLRFVHPLLRSAIYSDIAPIERAEAHRRAARLLDMSGADGETVAAQLLPATATGDPWVVERLRAAAARSISRGVAESAASYLERALSEPPPPRLQRDVLLELGRVEALAGRAEGLARLDEALKLTADARERAEILHELGWTLQKRGDVPGAIDAFERGLAELAEVPADDPAARSLDVSYLQIGHFAVLDEELIAERAGRVVAETLEKPARELDPHERGLLAALAGRRLYHGHPHREAIALAEQAWGGGRLLEQVGADSHTVWHVIASLSWADALDAAEENVEAALATARREGSPVTLALGLYVRSWPRYWRGELSAAAADAKAAVSAWSGDFSMYLPVAAYWLALAQIELDDLPDAEALELPDAERRWAGSVLYGAYVMRRGVLAMARGRPEDAVRWFEAVGESVIGVLVPNPAVMPWRSQLALARRALGDASGAREAAAEELQLALRFGAPRPIGIAQRAAGLVEGGAEGIELLGRSVETLRHSPSQLELARSLVELGAALRRSGRRAGAREPLREGLAMAERFGAVVLERQARGELEASGARLQPRAGRPADILTPSERRVAELAAAGLTNREIAQQLFVTVKAVQFHLTSMYRKLQITSRAELPGVLEAPRR